MSIISIPNTFTVGATIVASQHNSNFSTIYNDYNGNIDHTNLSASAAIADTQLAQISTASKISGAALTLLGNIPASGGTIPSKNGGTGGDLSVAVQGSVPYFSATGIESALAPGTSGQVLMSQGASANPIFSAPTGLGAWASKSVNTSIQATTDGFVTAFVQNANNNTNLQGLSDSANPPTTLRAAFSSSSGASGSSYCSITFPVKKNDYYKITYGTADSITIYFIPLGI